MMNETAASQGADEFERELQQAFLARHPGAATAALEELDPEALVETFVSQPVETMLGVWARLAPPIGSKLLSSLPEDVRDETLQHLNSVHLARLLAAAGEEEREAFLELLERRKARAVRSLLVYPPDRAGAMMDAGVRTLREPCGDDAGQEQRNRDGDQPTAVQPVIGDSDGRDDEPELAEVGDAMAIQTTSPKAMAINAKSMVLMVLAAVHGRQALGARHRRIAP